MQKTLVFLKINAFFLQKNAFSYGKYTFVQKKAFSCRKMHFPTGKCGSWGTHGRKPQEIAGGSQGSKNQER